MEIRCNLTPICGSLLNSGTVYLYKGQTWYFGVLQEILPEGQALHCFMCVTAVDTKVYIEVPQRLDLTKSPPSLTLNPNKNNGTHC